MLNQAFFLLDLRWFLAFDLPKQSKKEYHSDTFLQVRHQRLPNDKDDDLINSNKVNT
ncbi:MAG: hypothetical protein ACI9XU_000454 [Arenicella sp.]|jgi:hypothetical protein